MMTPEHLVFWIVSAAGCTLAGWWLSVRPQASYRGIAAPVSGLLILMAITLCMLAVSGQDTRSITLEARRFVLGR